MTTDNSGAHATAPAPTPASSRARPDPNVMADDSLSPARREAVAVSVGDQRQDPVRWSAVWAGLLVALAMFILLELLFFSLGWLTLAQGEPGSTAGWISALIGLFAFFAGGVVAGGSSIWRGAREGMMHGVLVWALGIVGIIFLTLFGGGALFGSLASAIGQAASLQQADLPAVELGEAVGTAREGAGWAVLGLALSLAAAAAGGMLGVKMGSSNEKSPQPATVDVS